MSLTFHLIVKFSFNNLPKSKKGPKQNFEMTSHLFIVHNMNMNYSD